MRDTKGNIEEPTWYACIGLMRHCEEGSELIHEWSKGYEGYTPEETNRKIKQQENFGSTTCLQFELNNPFLCMGCPHKGLYSSPIQAGYPKREAIKPTEEDRTEMPKGFKLTAEGIEFEIKDNEPGKVFYDEDMYPIDMAYDRSSKQMISKWIRKDRHEGWKEFSFRSALTKDPKAMAMTLQDNNIIVVGKNNLNIMIYYLETYMKGLNERRKARQISNQLGWQDFDGEQVFVLGDKVFYQNGTVINSGFTSNSPEIAKYFKAEGYMDRWVRTTQLFRNPSMLPHAFLFLASAFASPLIRFTGHEGATMSIWGKTGAGKSLIVKYGISAYGQPKELIIRADDTPNALINRVGVYNSLPVLLDEITTMKDELLGDLIYRITGGRDKLRLNRNASERASINRWNTLCFTTSNTSTVEKLGGYKGDPEAQINRVLEYELPDEQYDYFSIYSLYDEKAKSETSGFDLSYGGVAEPYIKYLLQHYNEHADKLRELTQQISAQIGAQPQERFWLAMIATTLYGGAIASKLGLIDFPLGPVKDWIFSMYPYFRGNKSENRVSSADFIGDLLSKYVKQILRLNNVRDGNPIWLGESGINQQMVGRYEKAAQCVWVSKNIIRQELIAKHMNYISIHRELSNMKPYAGIADEYKNLGEGTPFSGTLQPCWKINLKCPQFGHIKVEEEKE